MEEIPFLEQKKKRQEGREAPEPEPEQQEAGNHDGTASFFEKGKERQEGRQAPESKPKSGRSRKLSWNKDDFQQELKIPFCSRAIWVIKIIYNI